MTNLIKLPEPGETEYRLVHEAPGLFRAFKRDRSSNPRIQRPWVALNGDGYGSKALAQAAIRAAAQNARATRGFTPSEEILTEEQARRLP